MPLVLRRGLDDQSRYQWSAQPSNRMRPRRGSTQRLAAALGEELVLEAGWWTRVSGFVWNEDQLPASPWLEDSPVSRGRLAQGQFLADDRAYGAGS
jgi:hypothetical protein